MVNVAIEDLVVAGPDGNSAFRSVFDFKAVDDIVVAIDVEADVAIGSVSSIDDSAAGNFGLEGNGTGRGAVFVKMDSPTAAVVGVGSSFYDDGGAGRCETVRLADSSHWLRRRSGKRIISRRGNVQSCTVSVNGCERTD